MRRNPWFALTVCWLLSLVSLSAQPLWATSKSTPAKPAQSHSASGTAAPKAAAASSNGAPASDKCDWKAEYTQYQAAQFEFDDLNLDAAATQFLALSTSCDPNIQAAAAARFVSVHVEMHKWWWQAGHYFPPLRWFHIHYPRVWWVIIIAGIFFLLLEFLIWLVSKYFPGNAVIMTPTPLTDGAKAQCDFFAARLQDSSIEAMRRVSRGGDGLQVSATTFLAIPSDTAKVLGSSLPTVKGVDLNSWVKFILYLYRYFNWRVECQVAFCPSAKKDDGTPAPPPRIVAFATVRYAWRIKGEPFHIDLPVKDEYDLHDAAFAIAVRIMGNHPPPKKGAVDFSNADSFRYFMHGLGSILLYEEEAGKAHPHQPSLDYWMNDTLNRFRKCVAQFPADPLPRYGFGIALAMRNQEVYVERLQQVQVKSACLAIGRSLAFRDLIHASANASHQKDLTQRFDDEAQFFPPLLELDRAPWPLLEEACRMFDSLTQHPKHDPKLKARATYNLALAYARLGRDKCILGRDLLAPHNLRNAGLEPSKHQTPEQKALLLQVECLRDSLNVRHVKADIMHGAPKHPHHLDCDVSASDKSRFDHAFAAFRAVRRRIQEDNDIHILAFKTDLIADHLTQEGYIYSDCAIDRFPIGHELSAEEKLEKAAQLLEAALEIKPNWNPAQIYLATVRRIQSGLADAYIDFLNSQIQLAQPQPAQPQPTQTNDEPQPKAGESHQPHQHNQPQQAAPPAPSKDKVDKDKKHGEQQASDLLSWQRQLNERQKQKARFAQESANLFAALQGLPWTAPQPTSSTDEATNKPTSDPATSPNSAATA